MTFNPSAYIRDRGFDDISNSATRGRTDEIKEGYLGQGKLLEALDFAQMLQKTAKVRGSVMRESAQRMAGANMFGGAVEGFTNLVSPAIKSAQSGGGPTPVPGDGGDAAGLTTPWDKGYGAFESGTPSFGGDYTYDFSKSYYPN